MGSNFCAHLVHHFRNSFSRFGNRSGAPRRFLPISRRLGRPEPARLDKSGKSKSRAGPAELRPSGYSLFGLQNPREFCVPFSRLMKKYGNLLFFLIFHQFALASQPARGGKGPLFKPAILRTTKCWQSQELRRRNYGRLRRGFGETPKTRITDKELRTITEHISRLAAKNTSS